MNPTPLPTPIDVAVDPNRVTPGVLGFLALLALIGAVVFLYFSMRKQLSRIDFDDDALPGGVRPLPKYATKAERRKAAARLDAAASGPAAIGKAPGDSSGPAVASDGQSVGRAGPFDQ
jgi:predicted lipid-binding transport protein (Tim44 family)